MSVIITLYILIIDFEVVEASFFDETNVEDFFEVWKLIYDDYSLMKDYIF